MPHALPRHTVNLLASSMYSQEGGIQRVTQMVLRCLRDMWPAVPVELFALHDCGPFADDTLAEDAREGLVAFHPFHSARLPYAVGVLRGLVERQPKLVISDHAHLNVLPRLARLVARFPWISFVYHAELQHLGLVRRHALRQTDLVIAISEFSARAARRIVGPDHPLAVCHLGLFPDYPGWAKICPPLPTRLAGRRVILIVGRMAGGERDKGHEALLHALPEVAGHVPDALLVIVGRGADEPRLRRLAEQLSVTEHVHFAGFVPDTEMPAYYDACEVFAMPSFAEGFGLVYLEAMYHAKPCVAGNRDAAQEVVLDGETGLLVEPGNAGQLARVFIQLLTDREQAARLGRAGKERLERHFTYEHFARRLQPVLAPFEPSA